MLRSSLSNNSSSASTVPTALPPYPNILSSRSRTRELPTSFHGILTPSSSMSQGSWSSSSTLVTTSRTRERLRSAELERDELRRAMDEQRAVAERLKREGGEAGFSPTEARLPAIQLKHEARPAGRKFSRRFSAGLFKAVCSTDLLFLIDTTGSMANYINAAKNQVKSIVDDIKSTFFNEVEVRIAVVGYKDHADTTNIQFLDFTPYSDEVKSFLSELKATGGGDEPEDVLGGLRQALNATWKQQTRCIIHIADAPPHGRILQNSACRDDTFPIPGSEPHGLTHEPLLRQMVGLNINYALLRINHSTDRMAFTFFEAYAAVFADCMLHTSNTYYSQASAISLGFGGSSKCSAKAGMLLFEEAELGTTFSALQHLVVEMVTSSASCTAVRVSASTARTSKADAWTSKTLTSLADINEDGDDVDNVKLETTPPHWEKSGWFNEKLEVEGFCPDMVVHGARTLNDMIAHDDNIALSLIQLKVLKRSQPFAQGALRVASYARTAASTDRFVVKSFKRGGKRLTHLAEDMRCQALCKAFALEFNALSSEEQSIDFIVTTCLKGKSETGSGDDCMSFEPFIEGTYVKYNNNCGFVNDTADRFNQTAQAFSHFTFERSHGRFLVADLQGVGHVLTDPAIHTVDPDRFKLADTNLGHEGFKFFFATHVCNSICTKLKLKSNASMIMSGRFNFRESWPSMNNTVCCSNKLCDRIVRLASAKKSDKFPGYQWCDACWPQLYASTVKWICVAPRPHHEFDVSDFFYESQGQSMPHKCPKHSVIEEVVSAPKTKAVGSGVRSTNFWAKLKFATKKKSTSRKSR